MNQDCLREVSSHLLDSAMPIRRTHITIPRYVVLIVIVIGWISGCGDKDAGIEVIRPVRTTIVTASPELIRRTYPAVVLPTKQAELAFKVSGRIVELPIRAAAEVKKGATIAQLDKRDFQTSVKRLVSQLDQANAKLAEMKAGAREEDMATLKSKVKAAKSQLETQQFQVERIRQLSEQGAVSQAELEQELVKLKTAETNLDVAEQELKKAEVGEREEVVQAQEAAIRDLKTQLSQAEIDLEETTLKAPFDGVIAVRSVDNFASIQANKVIAVIQSLEKIDLEFDIPGVDVAEFGQRSGTRHKARLDAVPGREFDAEFVEFGTQADSATQTYRGRLSIPNPEDVTVLPGMAGSIVIEIPLEDHGQLTIPESALAGNPDGSYIWIFDQQKKSVGKRTVTAHKLSGGNVSITGDVKEGDVVVTAGVTFLREGMTVKISDANGE